MAEIDGVLKTTPWLIPKNDSQPIQCLSVYDGDTITVRVKVGNEYFKDKLRLFGINTPELKTKHLPTKQRAIAARDFLKEKIVDKDIYIHFHKREKYGRILATIYENKEDVEQNNFIKSINFQLIKSKHAVPFMLPMAILQLLNSDIEDEDNKDEDNKDEKQITQK
eukprot:Pgem_evm6s4769